MTTVLIRRTVRRPVSLAPAVVAARLAVLPVVAMTVKLQALAVVPPPAEVSGEAHQVIAPVVQVANGHAVAQGVADQVTVGVTQSAAGTPVAVGQASQIIGGISQEAAALVVGIGAASQAIAATGQAASGSVVGIASAAQIIAPVHQEAYQEAIARGAADQTIAPITQAATGRGVMVAAAVQAIAPMDQSAAGSAVAVASGNQVSGDITQAALGSAVGIGQAEQDSAAVTQVASGSAVKVAVTAQTIGDLVQAIAGTKVAKGQAAQALAALAQSAAGSAVARGQASQTIGAMTWAASGSAVAKGSAAQTIGAMVQTASGSSGPVLPTYVGVAPFVNGTGAISPTFASSGRASGDLLLLFVESANQAVTTPSGWGLLPSTPQSTGTAAAAGGVRLTVYWKVSDGTETTVSVADSGDHTTACGLVVRGVNTTAYTNLIKNSNGFTNTGFWTKFNAGDIQTNATIGPDGVSTSCRLTITSPTNQDDGGGIFTQTTTGLNLLAGNTTYTLSIWARGTSATQKFAIGWFGQQGAVEYGQWSPDQTVTTAWTRVSFTFTTDAGTYTYNNIGIVSDAAADSVDILIADIQLETGTIVSPALRTTNGTASSIRGIVAQAGKVQAATTSVGFPAPIAPGPALVVNALANDRDAAATGNLTSVTNADLTSLTTRIDQTVTDGQGGGLAVITGGKSSAGVITATTATNAASVANASITLALAA